LSEDKSQATGRKYVGIYFECCRVYTRIYRSRLGDRYVGYCPKCGRRVNLKIGSDGTDDRFFVAK
jgi:hypothetical protein